MYELPIYYPARPLKDFVSDLVPILDECGFSYRLVDHEASQTRLGGQVNLRYLNLSHTSRKRRGITSDDDSMLRMTCLHERLMSKPWRDKDLYPKTDISVNVKCCNQIHKITITAKDEIVLHQHPMSKLEDDLAMCALAGAEKPPRCIRIFDAWRHRKKARAGDMLSATHKEIPAMIKGRFRHAWQKYELRDRIHLYMTCVDTLTIPFYDRLRPKAVDTAYKQLLSCKYGNWLLGSEHAKNAWFGLDTYHPDIELTNDTKSNIFFDSIPNLTSSDGKAIYQHVLKIRLADPVRWYAKVHLQGLSVVDGHFVLDVLSKGEDGPIVNAIRCISGPKGGWILPGMKLRIARVTPDKKLIWLDELGSGVNYR